MIDGVRAGEVRAVARAISLVEDAAPQLREVMAGITGGDHTAQVIGITGPPGVGKSTSTSALVGELRRRDKRVGVLAVDPSSPYSGGALLGDRIRMQEHTLDEGVYIRSMASRGHLGGLSWAAPHALRVLEAAGFDVVILETVGVGQSEVEIAGLADTTAILLAPGMGDGVQAAKAGLLEVGDLYVINKADHDGANQLRRELRTMLSMTERLEGDWTPPILLTVATNGEGVAEVADAVEEHRKHLEVSGEIHARRLRRARDEVQAIAVAEARRQWADVGEGLDELAADVAKGRIDPYAAADKLLAEVASGS